MSADPYDRVLEVADRHARRYLSELPDRPVREAASVDELRGLLGRELPDKGEDPATVIDELARAAEPGLIATAGPRYFVFVIGGSLPAALGADLLATAWDQVASLYVCGPSAGVAEEVAGRWVLELLGLPPSAAFGLTTGGTMANFAGIAAGRHAVLKRAGWDVEARGLQDAPRVRVLVGEHAHATIFVALRMLGLGTDNAVRVEADDAGRMRPDRLAAELERGDGPAIVCAQAGEVNTGCFDPVDEIAGACERHGAWLHVDGAIGLWTAATPKLAHLTRGLRADFGPRGVRVKNVEPGFVSTELGAGMQDAGQRAVLEQMVQAVPPLPPEDIADAIAYATAAPARVNVAQMIVVPTVQG